MCQIVKLNNQGFCYGVKRAIRIALDIRKNERSDVYLLGDIVHNDYIHNLLEHQGIKIINGTNRLLMLDEVPPYSTIIFSAHGVSDKVVEKALKLHLNIIDATCPYVHKTFELVNNTINDKTNLKAILFIGKANHPESEAMLELSDYVYLIDPNHINESINMLPDLSNYDLYLAHQTTMSSFDIEHIYQTLLTFYKNIHKLDMICKVTENRQIELKETISSLNQKSLILVVGDKKSNNSTKLYELASRSKNDTIFIESINDLDLNLVLCYETIVLASGTSTPYTLVMQIEDVLNNIDYYLPLSNNGYLNLEILDDQLIKEL